MTDVLGHVSATRSHGPHAAYQIVMLPAASYVNFVFVCMYVYTQTINSFNHTDHSFTI